MALLLKVDPVGIDRPIDKIQQALYTGLVTNGTWTMYESYHRAYKNETKDGIVPEIFTGKKDYKDAFTDDGFTATSFFLIPDEVGVVEGQKFQAEISIIFQVDLAKLYPNAPDSRRFDEEMHNEILNILNDLDANFTDVDYVTSLDSVYAGLDTSKIKWNDLQPYHVVRFTVTANYDYQCNPVFATAGLVCTIGVDMSKTDPTTIGGNDGTATATPTGGQGSISYEWDDPANQTTQTATGLTDGTYTCIVTDSIISIPPCDTLGMIELEDPAPICNISVVVSVTPETSEGLNDGTASSVPSGGQGTLSYLWTTGDGSIPVGTETNQNITGLSPGTYTVVVTDDIIVSPVCSATDNGTVDAGDPFSFGNCLDFDGVNDRVELDTTVSVGTSTDFTFSIWLYQNTQTADQCISEGDGAGTKFIWLKGGLNTVRVDSATKNFTIPARTNNTWNHLVVSVRSGFMHVYWNGVESTTGSIAFTAVWSVEMLGSYVGSSRFFDGRMDEFLFKVGYGATTADVVSLYNSGNGIDSSTIITSPDVHLKFNESGSDTVAVDSSVNGNDGTLINFTLPGAWVDHDAP